MTDQNSATPSPITRDLCEWLHTLQLSDVPEEVAKRTKYLILDGIACGIVGSHLPWSETATNGVLSMEAEGACSVWGWEKVCSPPCMVFIIYGADHVTESRPTIRSTSQLDVHPRLRTRRLSFRSPYTFIVDCPSSPLCFVSAPSEAYHQHSISVGSHRRV